MAAKKDSPQVKADKADARRLKIPYKEYLVSVADANKLLKEQNNLVDKLQKKGIEATSRIREQGTLQATLNGSKLEEKLIAEKLESLKGKDLTQRKKIFEDAQILSKSGVFAIVLECIVENLAKKITKSIDVPTIGIGASKHCDGQILVIDDMLGLSDFYPKFVKRYSNLKKIIEKSIKNYAKDVKLRKFPFNKNVYN